LTTISEFYINKTKTNGHNIKRRFIDCICDCGKACKVDFNNLHNGTTKSCGCLSREPKHLTHGYSHTRIHTIWRGMIQRCYNPKRTYYSNYGGRGITVCKRWLNHNGNGLSNFIKDMGLPPTDKHSLDRINSNGNYTKLNCKWSTQKEQCRNTRKNTLVVYNGENRYLWELCESLKLPKTLIWTRLRKGFSIDEAISTPKFKHLKK
jgi:hypothetical protein